MRMITRQFSVAATLLVVGLLAGCTSMPQGTFPMQNMSRVPPPGTGTYNLPGNYYNNAPTVGQTSSSSSGLKPIQGSLPTTNLTALNSPVQPAQYVGTVSSAPVNTAGTIQPISYSDAGSGADTMGIATFSDGRFGEQSNSEHHDNQPNGSNPNGSDLNSNASNSFDGSLPSDPTLNWK